MTYEITPLEQVERFNKLADVIESHPDQFDMAFWMQEGPGTNPTLFAWQMREVQHVDLLALDCKTRGCVAGWAAGMWAGELTVEQNERLSIKDAAEQLLGLDPFTAAWLFDANAEHQAPEDAAEVLRDLAGYVEEHGATTGFTDGRGNRT